MKVTMVSAVFEWSKHSPKWRNNIKRALESWLRLGFDVVYCSQEVLELNHPGRVTFTGDEDFPKIGRLLKACSEQSGLACLLDADLVVGRGILEAIKHINGQDVKMLVSRRWNYSPHRYDATHPESVANYDESDHSVDFFLGDASLFAEPSNLIVPDARVAHNLWDTWLVGYFNQALGPAIRGATRYKFLFHPQHDERKQIYPTHDFPHDRYRAAAAHPDEL